MSVHTSKTLKEHIASRSQRLSARRSHHIKGRVTFRTGELIDLETIAIGWDCPVATVIWIVMADWLAKARSRELRDTPMNVSAKDVLDRAGYYSALPEGLDNVGEQLDRASAWSRVLACSRELVEAHQKRTGDRYPLIIELREALTEYDATQPGGPK